MDFYGFEGRSGNLPGAQFGLFDLTSADYKKLATSEKLIFDALQKKISEDLSRLKIETKRVTEKDVDDAPDGNALYKTAEEALKTEEEKKAPDRDKVSKLNALKEELAGQRNLEDE